jgi:hypothetical protein
MQKIDGFKEIRLALTRAGIATCPEKCLQTFRLVVTAQYIYHRSEPVDPALPCTDLVSASSRIKILGLCGLTTVYSLKVSWAIRCLCTGDASCQSELIELLLVASHKRLRK